MELNFSTTELKNALIPEWNCEKNNTFIVNTQSVNITTYTNYKDLIINEFNKSNYNNDLTETFDETFIEKIIALSNSKIHFEFGFIKISTNDLIFPICDVGKNRSQFMFYYLKNIQALYNNVFLTGYPSSGDELKSIIEKSNGVLSSFIPRYKSDNFSNVMLKIFNKEVSRSIHVFDNLLKKKEEYNDYDLKNYETHKYIEHKHNIFDTPNDNIKDLFKKYFLTPANIKNHNITYLCLSPDSFYNMCNLLYFMNKTEKMNFENTRIIYFGIKDIFQTSTIKTNVLNNFLFSIQMRTYFNE